MNSTPWGEEGTNQDEGDRRKTIAAQGIDEREESSSPLNQLAAPSSPSARCVHKPTKSSGFLAVAT
jgi:hypothetical protein